MSAKFSRRRFIAAGSAAVAAPFLWRRAAAQAAWPSRQIRMICSYPAGGQTDLLARAFGEFISRQVAQTVVIENKAGASGAIGAAEVARAEGDGHTILCSISTTYVMNRVMMKNPGYDMDKDLTLVSVIPGAGLLLVANPKSGVRTLDEFVAFARNSGKANFGTYSAGSSPHITINELNRQYGLNIEPIHYRGEAPMWTGSRKARSMSRWAATRPRNPSCKAIAASCSRCIRRRWTRSRTSEPCPNRARRRSSSP
jgi:tripartite-type tricarboxylate transporter receptor subunit TctC